MVFTEQVWRGTHQGEFQGVAATGNMIEVTDRSVARIENGLTVEEWSGIDLLSLMQQIGAIPSG